MTASHARAREGEILASSKSSGYSDEVRRQDHELCVHDQAERHGCRHDSVNEAVRQCDRLGHRGPPRQLGCSEAVLWSSSMTRRLLGLLRQKVKAGGTAQGALTACLNQAK